MNRDDLKILAEARITDAEALLKAGRWAAAYYLLGYAVECALKACASRQFGLHEVPDKKIVESFYTHQLRDKLLAISGVKDALAERATIDSDFRAKWNAVCDWEEAARYDHTMTEQAARDMFVAVTDPKSGVLPWLRTFW